MRSSAILRIGFDLVDINILIEKVGPIHVFIISRASIFERGEQAHGLRV